MRQPITSIAISLSTFCDMKCPNCCCAMQILSNKQKHFFDLCYLLQAARLFYGIDRIHITGGEPTLHPDFLDIVPRLKHLFGCNKLTIETNGFGFERFKNQLSVFLNFDTIYFSHYRKDFYEGFEDNEHLIAGFLDWIDEYVVTGVPEVVVGEIDHVDRSLRPGKNICHRGTSEAVAYVDGKIYPCCIGSGLDTKVCLENPGPDWRERILEINPPCEECFFALP